MALLPVPNARLASACSTLKYLQLVLSDTANDRLPQADLHDVSDGGL